MDKKIKKEIDEIVRKGADRQEIERFLDKRLEEIIERVIKNES